MNHNQIFLIWSGKHHAWWREHGLGYTNDKVSAGYFTISDLIELSLEGTSQLDRYGKPTRCDVLVPFEACD